MKTKVNVLVCASVVLLVATSSPAQNLAVNMAQNTATSLAENLAEAPPPEVPRFGVETPELGQPLLPSEVKAALRLSSLQLMELGDIERYFDQKRQEYQSANLPRILAAYEADRAARLAKDERRMQLAYEELTLIWSSFAPEREAAMARVKLLLTPEQLQILETYFGR